MPQTWPAGATAAAAAKLTADAIAQTRTAIRDEIAKVETCGRGGRNNTLNAAAFALGHRRQARPATLSSGERERLSVALV